MTQEKELLKEIVKLTCEYDVEFYINDKKEFQLMPNNNKMAQLFFRWYVVEKPQWFESAVECVCNWIKWEKYWSAIPNESIIGKCPDCGDVSLVHHTFQKFKKCFVCGRFES